MVKWSVRSFGLSESQLHYEKIILEITQLLNRIALAHCKISCQY